MQVLFFVLLALVGQTAGDFGEFGDADAALKGLGPFMVLVENIPPHSPLDQKELSTAVELRLRSLGIEITGKRFKDAYLYVNLMINKIDLELYETTLYYYSATISFCDVVLLKSNKRKSVVVWSTQFIASTPALDAKKNILDSVLKNVDEFANAWLKTNPKEPEKMKPETKENK